MRIVPGIQHHIVHRLSGKTTDAPITPIDPLQPISPVRQESLFLEFGTYSLNQQLESLSKITSAKIYSLKESDTLFIPITTLDEEKEQEKIAVTIKNLNDDGNISLELSVEKAEGENIEVGFVKTEKESEPTSLAERQIAAYRAHSTPDYFELQKEPSAISINRNNILVFYINKTACCTLVSDRRLENKEQELLIFS